MPLTRLQKLLSQAGVASRRKAEELIKSGHVKVNGKLVTELGTQADPEQDKITVSGKVLSFTTQHHYYAYYKPRGLVVSKSDELGRRTIFDELRSPKYQQQHQLNLPNNVNYVGRLDKDSEGLLLLTDDGEFIHQYTHPSFEVPKVYLVELSRRPNEGEVRQLLSGIPLEEKTVRVLKIQPDYELQKRTQRYWVEIEICDGIKREIRRMMEFLDIEVWRLIRIQHGSIKLKELEPNELKLLKNKPGLRKKLPPKINL